MAPCVVQDALLRVTESIALTLAGFSCCAGSGAVGFPPECLSGAAICAGSGAAGFPFEGWPLLAGGG